MKLLRRSRRRFLRCSSDSNARQGSLLFLRAAPNCGGGRLDGRASCVGIVA